MNFIKKICSFLKKIFHKEDSVKMLQTPVERAKGHDKENFIDSLKINVIKEKKKVETLTCEGDGLGIQSKITY